MAEEWTAQVAEERMVLVAEERTVPAAGNPHVTPSDYPAADLPWVLAVLRVQIEPPLFLVCLLKPVPLLAPAHDKRP